MKIEVTQNDIDKGERHVSDNCPIARAVKRATRRKDVTVWSTSEEIVVYKDDYCSGEGELAQKVKKFVDDFDRGLEVKPFSFVLKGYKRKEA